MARFKVGDTVKRVGSSFKGARVGNCYTVTNTSSYSGVGIKLSCGDDVIYDARNFVLVTQGDELLSPAAPLCWDYGEAQRLQDAAKAAVKAYNEYVDLKPETIFLKMPDY